MVRLPVIPSFIKRRPNHSSFSTAKRFADSERGASTGYRRIPFNKCLHKIGGFKEDSVEKVFYKTIRFLWLKNCFSIIPCVKFLMAASNS